MRIDFSQFLDFLKKGQFFSILIQGEVLRQTRSLQQVSNITYEGFLASITELNEISGHFLDSNGKQLVFAMKKGSDSSFLWKATVRIACVKIDSTTKNIGKIAVSKVKNFTTKW